MILEVVAVDDGDGSGRGLRSLGSWLVEDPTLRAATVRVVPGGDASQDMGAGAELLQVIAAPGGVLTAVVTAVGAWLASRSAGTRLRVRKGEVEVEVVARPGQDPEDLAMRILGELGDT